MIEWLQSPPAGASTSNTHTAQRLRQMPTTRHLPGTGYSSKCMLIPVAIRLPQALLPVYCTSLAALASCYGCSKRKMQMIIMDGMGTNARSAAVALNNLPRFQFCLPRGTMLLQCRCTRPQKGLSATFAGRRRARSRPRPAAAMVQEAPCRSIPLASKPF